ncbi:MAG: outer membrane lipoprotein-sorting protein [Myxococcota bacterium]
MKSASCRLAALVFLFALPAPASALDTVEEIEACMQANRPTGSSIQTIAMETRDRVGATRSMRSKIYWQEDDQKRAQVMMRFDEPPDMRGSSLLMLERKGENQMFMYLPELGRVKRVSRHMMSGSLFGTDFTYEQFEWLQGFAENQSSERLPDVDLDGRPTYLLESVPAAEGSEWETIRSYIDHASCVLTKAEFFEKGAKLRKVLVADPAKITLEGELHLARELVMRDLRDETETTVGIEDVELGAKIKRKIFTTSELERAGR